MARNVYTTSSADLIAAPATAAGHGPVAIVRLSGNGAIEAAARLHSALTPETEPGRMVLGTLAHADSGEHIDQALAVIWRAPRSYTGEDMAEFHLHGSPAIVEAALSACIAAGARLAEPGEFTRRAFLNGKIDLAQAEAVCRLTRARTDDSRRAALRQLEGGLSRALRTVRESLVQTTAEIEARIDYPEEGIPPESTERFLASIDSALQRVGDLLSTARRGRLLEEGARLVFAGPPNAGKSSLFNALLRRERAIVSPHPGTTRDTLEAVIDLRGIAVTLVDTAGLRTIAEEIEALGIARSRQEIETADLVLFVVDLQGSPAEALDQFQNARPFPHLLVLNKAEEPSCSSQQSRHAEIFSTAPDRIVYTSALRRTGINELEEAVLRHFLGSQQESDGSLLASARHEGALLAARESLESAAGALRNDLSAEYVATDLAEALSQLDSILGLGNLDEDILDAVFSTFCLGK